mgnify:CR=1 FL=1
MDVTPAILEARTLLPLRFVAENLGCGAEWDQDAQKVMITKADSSTGIGIIPGLIKESGISLVPGEMTLNPEFDELNLAEGNKWPTDKYVTMIHFVSNEDEWAARRQGNTSLTSRCFSLSSLHLNRLHQLPIFTKR